MRHATEFPADYPAVAVRAEAPLPLDCLTTRVSLGESLSYALQFVGKRLIDFLVAGLGCLVLLPGFAGRRGADPAGLPGARLLPPAPAGAGREALRDVEVPAP